jgi:hypothetical protein
MRNFCSAAIAANLLFASAVQAQPLTPGKPAGVAAARLHAGAGLLLISGLLVAGLAVAIASTGGDSNAGLVVPTNTGTTGTTS